jgi:hypothetical protein
MRRFVGILIAAVVAVALPVAAHAQASKTTTVTGTVSAVTMASMTVKGTGTQEWTFTIDKDTSVTAKGATHKTMEMSAQGKGVKVTDVVKTGDRVSVDYHDMGTMKHAASIRVTSPSVK